MDRPTIELAKEVQKNLNLQDEHVVWFGEKGFTIAHTDQERESNLDLEECQLHKILLNLDYPPVDPGWYKVAFGGECLYNVIPIDENHS